MKHLNQLKEKKSKEILRVVANESKLRVKYYKNNKNLKKFTLKGESPVKFRIIFLVKKFIFLNYGVPYFKP